MNKSNETSELFAALSKFQGELDMANKAKTGHGYKYADLAECIITAKQGLADNGLAVIQLLDENEKGTALETVLTHSSGQYISSSFVMERAILQGGAGKNPAQAMGASITYMRRYAYAAIVGLAQEDDDAAKVRAQKESEREALEAAKNYDPTEDIAKLNACKTVDEMNSVWGSLCDIAKKDKRVITAGSNHKQALLNAITPQQLKQLQTLYSGIDRDKRLALVGTMLNRNIESFKDLTTKEANYIIENTNREELN
jgi:hypothetical protein